jgi:transposase InsO family protein
MAVLAHIREQYSLSLGSYGRPRMTMELKEVGFAVGERRVGRLMKINGIQPVHTRRHKVATDSHHRLGVAANWLDGDFVVAASNQKWAVSDRMKKDLTIRALDMAVRLRNPPPGCMFHSDRGSQYCSYDYQKKLQTYGLQPSMSGKGNCYHNSAVETLLASPPFGSNP